jgi:hypothetical protein
MGFPWVWKEMDIIYVLILQLSFYQNQTKFRPGIFYSYSDSQVLQITIRFAWHLYRFAYEYDLCLISHQSQVEDDETYSACTAEELEKQHRIQQVLHIFHQSVLKWQNLVYLLRLF